MKFTILASFIFIGVLLLFVSGWTETNLEYWLTMIKGQPVDVPYWIAACLTFFTNVFGLIFNLVSELLKLVL